MRPKDARTVQGKPETPQLAFGALVTPLAPERWRRLRPLLDQALDLRIDERRRFLDALGPEQIELRADLERLIERHLETDGIREPAAALAGHRFEHTDLLPAAHQAPFVGRRIGPYQLTRLLGAGGMGAVYEGQRVDGGFRQTVAIKLVAGLHPGLNARFAQERQIVAELRHPQIAQLLDGGQTDDGMPYFALEYVDGQPITEFADEHGADVDQRLRLLIEVADALAYAHRCNVIHRDIKPTNILVSADGHVKLLDFGIAKLFKDVPGATLTQQQIGPMTPEYAAPEQFRGIEVTPATDVYQFGVLMFRLLTGRLPYRAEPRDGLAWARAVAEEEPLTLTGALREACEAGGDSSLSEITLRQISARRGAQLDAIVRRCLAKEKAQRYSSMEALIEDLQAHLRPAVPRAIGGLRRALLLAAALLGAVSIAAVFGYYLPLFDQLAWRQTDPWSEEPALLAFGLRRENLHVATPEGELRLREAFDAEARGELPSAAALFETLHESDRRTPIPALILAYWNGVIGTPTEVVRWRKAAHQRMAQIDDPYLSLLSRFFDSDTDESFESSMQYSGALVRLRPRAWFFRLARAHSMNERGLREAALKELQAIEVSRLGHRKLVDAIADRGSLGDLPGALALVARMQPAPEDPERAALQARLAYSGGDLKGARDFHLDAVRLARRIARFDIESRSLLWAGVYTGTLGDYGQARDYLKQAKERLSQRLQYTYATDAAMVLAHIAALSADRAQLTQQIADARRLAENIQPNESLALLELGAARLSGQPIRMATIDRSVGSAVLDLMSAREALQKGHRELASAGLVRALDAGIGDGIFVEEAALLARDLQMPAVPLSPIDPPFAPYQRFAARWMLGQGLSAVPPRPEILSATAASSTRSARLPPRPAPRQ